MTHDLVVVGFSAGGVPVFLDVARALPADLQAAVMVTFHQAPSSASALPALLTRSARLPTTLARHGETLEPRHIYVGPPGLHLLVHDGRIALGDGPRENGHRPSVDALFRTAARTFGSRTIAVLLSGNLDDGAAGAHEVHRAGGVVVVQDPEEAAYPGMPRSAMETTHVDHVCKAFELPGLLARLAGTGPRAFESAPAMPPDQAEGDIPSLEERLAEGAPSALTCPECGGAMWRSDSGRLERYACHVGHTYTAEGLLSAGTRQVENALWRALRILRENAAVAGRLARRARKTRRTQQAGYFEDMEREAREHARVLLEALRQAERMGTVAARRGQTRDPTAN